MNEKKYVVILVDEDGRGLEWAMNNWVKYGYRFVGMTHSGRRIVVLMEKENTR